MAPLESGGELVKLDWRRKQILARVPIVPDSPVISDPNPRGGTRGGRGVLLTKNEVYVASYHSIKVFDRNLHAVRSFSNPFFAGLHEIAWQDDDLWVSCTELDGLVKVDRSGNTLDGWWPREDPITRERFGLPALALDKTKDNRLAYLGVGHEQPGHTHLNAVALLQGRPVVLLNRYGCLVRLNPTEILVEDEALRGAHNVLVTSSNELIVNDTVNQRVLQFGQNGNARRKLSLGRFWPVRKIQWRFGVRSARLWVGNHVPSFRLQSALIGNLVASRPVFVRGLCETGRGTVLVGISPSSILEIDWASGRLVDFFEYSSDVNNAIHGLACDDAGVG